MDCIPIRKLEELLNRQPLCSGSSIKIVEICDDKIVIKLEGTCTGCPGIRITLGDIIEAAIKEHFPAIKEVILDSSCDEEMLAFVRQLLNHDGQVAT